MANGMIQLYKWDNTRLQRWLVIELVIAIAVFIVWFTKDIFFRDGFGAYDFTITCIIITTPFLVMIFTAVFLHLSKRNTNVLVENIILRKDEEHLLEKNSQASGTAQVHYPLYGSSCVICLEKENLVALPNCGHGFHESCITKWFMETRDPVCPSCRQRYEENAFRQMTNV